MGVSVRVGPVSDELGAPSFVHAFFSTICAYCEAGAWGSKYPALMGPLYKGQIDYVRAKVALEELRAARQELSKVVPAHVVWDLQDRSAQPPWGDRIAATITNLGNYFITSEGRDIFEVLDEALTAAVAERETLFVE